MNPLTKQRQPKSEATKGAPNIDRLPPHSIEAEQGVLGCCLMSPDSCIPEAVVGLGSAGHANFYDLRHQTLWQAMLEVRDQGALDTITLQSHLKDVGELENIGGLAYLVSLPEAVPSAANLAYYLDIVREKYVLRKLVQTCTGLVGRVFNEEDEGITILDKAENDILAIRKETLGVEDSSKMKLKMADAAITEWETAFANPGKISGITSGLIDLDRATWGWQKRNLIVIGARPSQGKTAAVLGYARAAAIENSVPTTIFSLESSGAELMKRLVCQMLRIDMKKLREGSASGREMAGIPHAFELISKQPLNIIYCPGASISRLRAMARREKEEHGMQLMVVDYLQKINPDTRHEKRTYEVGQASGGLKVIAEELDVPVIAACQLNRESENNKGKGQPPMLKDLGDSGMIERDADLVWFIWRKETSGEPQHWLVNGKFRDGPGDSVRMAWLPHCTRFDNHSRVEEGDFTEAGQTKMPYND